MSYAGVVKTASAPSFPGNRMKYDVIKTLEVEVFKIKELVPFEKTKTNVCWIGITEDGVFVVDKNPIKIGDIYEHHEGKWLKFPDRFSFSLMDNEKIDFIVKGIV